MNQLPVRLQPFSDLSEPRPAGDRRPGFRILMVAACPFPAARGTPARILRMAETLANRGHEVHVVAYNLGDKVVGDFPFHLHRIARVPTYTKLDPGPSMQKLLVLDAMLAWKVETLARQLKPDVIHAHHFEGLLVSLPAKKLHGIPLIFDAHVLLEGELSYYRTGLPDSIRSRLSRMLDRRLPAMASHVVAVADEIREILICEHGFSGNDVSVVANGVEPEFFSGNPARYPKRGRRLLFTGNLAAYQGTEGMLKALALILEQHRDVTLTVTTTSDTSEFRQVAAGLGVESALEFIRCDVPDIPDLIASADVALNPRTRCPGIPQKLLNYMAGAAPIVSYRGSGKYLHNGVNALVVEDDDIAGFAKAALRLLQEPALARRIGRNAREFARSNLSWDNNSRVVEQVYRRLCRARQQKIA